MINKKKIKTPPKYKTKIKKAMYSIWKYNKNKQTAIIRHTKQNKDNKVFKAKTI